MTASCVPTHIFNMTFWDKDSGSFEKMASTYKATLRHQHIPTILLLTCRYMRTSTMVMSTLKPLLERMFYIFKAIPSTCLFMESNCKHSNRGLKSQNKFIFNERHRDQTTPGSHLHLYTYELFYLCDENKRAITGKDNSYVSSHLLNVTTSGSLF
jgi:hypothetical protein